MGAKQEPANPYNQQVMRGILTAFHPTRPDDPGRPLKRSLIMRKILQALQALQALGAF
jgi:hypothetical protein